MDPQDLEQPPSTHWSSCFCLILEQTLLAACSDVYICRYDSIAHNEISIQSQAGPESGTNPLLWAELDLQAQTPRGTLLDVSGLSTPTLSAIGCNAPRFVEVHSSEHAALQSSARFSHGQQHASDQHLTRQACAGTPAVDREMFALMWSPTVAAVSVVLDHAEEVMALQGHL